VKIKRIVISRTDSIGDVVLTLPIVSIIKNHFSNAEIIFLGNSYTEPIIKLNSLVDEIVRWDELSKKTKEEKIKFFEALNADAIIHVFPRKDIAKLVKKARIRYRVGTSHRLYHLFTCNKLVSFSRKKSNLHEAQLNMKLLKGIGIDQDIIEVAHIHKYYSIKQIPQYSSALLSDNKFNLALHPKSKGSAVEWGVENFIRLIELLPKERFNIFVTGTEAEGKLVRSLLPKTDNVHDVTGKMSLNELIGFINKCDGLVAASTGPLHIAAMLGIHSLGLYSPLRPIHPGRWKPIGLKSKVFVKELGKQKNYRGGSCEFIQKITPEEIASYLERLV